MNVTESECTLSFQRDLLPQGLSTSVKLYLSVEDHKVLYGACGDRQAVPRWIHIQSRSQTRQFGLSKDAMTVQAAWGNQAPEGCLHRLFVIPWKATEAPQQNFSLLCLFHIQAFFFFFPVCSPEPFYSTGSSKLSYNKGGGIILNPSMLGSIYPPKDIRVV